MHRRIKDLIGILSGRRPVDDAHYEKQMEEMATFRHPTLSPQARARIWREALRRAAETTLPLRRSFQFRLRWVAIPLVALFLLSSFSVVAAAQGSLPSDSLYLVKNLSEEIWFTLTPSSQRPVVALELAARRIEEVGQLAQRGQAAPDEVVNNLEIQLVRVNQISTDQLSQHEVVYRLRAEVQSLEEQANDLPLNSNLLLTLSVCQRTLATLATQSTGAPEIP